MGKVKQNKEGDCMLQIGEDTNEIKQYLYDTALDIAKLVNAHADNKEDVIEIIDISLQILK